MSATCFNVRGDFRLELNFLETDFNFGNKKKSQGARSEGGQSDFWHKTCELIKLSGQAHCHDEEIMSCLATTVISFCEFFRAIFSKCHRSTDG